jgi:acyl-CoA synthetase (NDP forming)
VQRTVLEELLNPRSVAVIGASENPNTFNGAPIHNLQSFGYPGEIYPINPNRDEVQGLPCHPSLAELPRDVETAIIVVSAQHALDALAQCIDRGIRSVTMVSSGFAEGAAGREGQVRARELEKMIESSGIRLLGPNSIGMVNLLDSYVPRAAHNMYDRDDLTVGKVALVTQSGACGNIVFNRAQANGVGVSISVATGDQTDVDVWDVCAAVMRDRRIAVTMAVIETFGDIAKFEAVAYRARQTDKPLVLLKIGQSDLGGAMVRTHTGALAGNAQVQRASLRQMGVASVDDFDELWGLASLIERWGPPRPGRPARLGVACFSGGEAGLIADHCARHGLDLPPTSEAFESYVEEHFDYASGSNPFDMTGEVIGRPSKVRLGLRAFVRQNGYDELLLASPLLRSGLARRYYQDLHEAIDGLGVRLVHSAWQAGDLTKTQVSILRATGAPVLPGSTHAVRALAGYRRAAGTVWRRRPPGRATGPAAAMASCLAPDASYFAVREALAGLGLAFGEARLTHTAHEAVEAAAAIGHPVVMKCNVASSAHKSGLGAVRLDVGGDDAVRRTFAELSAVGARSGAAGIVVEETVNGPVQVLLGGTRDPEFGDVIVFGSGGVTAEEVRDVAMGLTRYIADEPAAADLLAQTAAGRYLRTHAPAAAKTLCWWILALGQWFAANEQVSSVDINPCVVNVSAESITAVDARVA